MDKSFRFSIRKRLGTLGPVLFIEAGLLALLGWRGHPGWRTAAVCAVVALLALRIATYLWDGRRPLTVTDEGVRRGRYAVAFGQAEVWLRTTPRKDALVPTELVVVTPLEGNRRIAVGFDNSLEDFAGAAKAVLLRVPDARVRVTAPGEPDVQGERREAVLEPLRPSPAERALASLGPPSLGSPRR